MKILASILIVAMIVVGIGCANPGIVKLSPDTYIIFRTDRGGVFGNAASMKASVIQDANDFAEKQGKVAIPISTHSTPMAVGQFATFEYQFRVVDKNDPEAQRTSLVPRADVVSDISVNIETKDQSEKTKDVYTELLKLDDLRKKGIISDEEFETQKKKLLSE